MSPLKPISIQFTDVYMRQQDCVLSPRKPISIQFTDVYMRQQDCEVKANCSHKVMKREIIYGRTP